MSIDLSRGIVVYTNKSSSKSIVEISSDLKFEECFLIEIRLRRGK